MAVDTTLIQGAGLVAKAEADKMVSKGKMAQGIADSVSGAVEDLRDESYKIHEEKQTAETDIVGKIHENMDEILADPSLPDADREMIQNMLMGGGDPVLDEKRTTMSDVKGSDPEDPDKGFFGRARDVREANKKKTRGQS